MILRSRTDHFAAIATREMGKLLREAKEVLPSADILAYYADNAAAMLARVAGPNLEHFEVVRPPWF